ncbi:MAG: hypothetical protein J6S58_09840, partial [Lentisphaeria bacterium]|nr:hypothetical protein [Lentisphaeria bacterium]
IQRRKNEDTIRCKAGNFLNFVRSRKFPTFFGKQVPFFPISKPLPLFFKNFWTDYSDLLTQARCNPDREIGAYSKAKE